MIESRFRQFLVAGALGAFAILIVLEFITETGEVSLADFAVDSISLLLTILGAAFAAALIDSVRRHRAEVGLLVGELNEARRVGAEWRAAVDHHVIGLRTAIDDQFDSWSISQAEREVALLILKGFSHKEIAALRNTSERTVREQAQQVYRKSGLSGKNALSAYFLEDLLDPAGAHLNGGGVRSGSRALTGRISSVG